MEEQGAARGAERQIAEFVEDDEIEAQQAFGELPGLVQGLFLFECVDQIDGCEEADFFALVLDGLHAQGGCDVALAGSRAADQHDIVGAIHKVAAVQLLDQGFIGLAGGKFEAGQVLVGWEPGCLDLARD